MTQEKLSFVAAALPAALAYPEGDTPVTEGGS